VGAALDRDPAQLGELGHDGGRQELADKESGEIAIYQAYLPQQLTEAEIDKFVAEAIASADASSIKDMGKVMGVLKPKLQGRADMGQVGSKVKTRLGAA